MKKKKAQARTPVPVRTGPTMRRLAKPTARKRARAYLVDGYCRPVAAISNYFGLRGNEMLALPRVTRGRRAFFGQARYIAEIGWDVWRDLGAGIGAARLPQGQRLCVGRTGGLLFMVLSEV